MSCSHEALSPYTRSSEAWDQVPIATIQKHFAQRLRGVLSRINAQIREAIVTNDLFNYHGEAEALVDDPPERIFDFPTDRAKIKGFMQWLRNQLDDQFLEVVGPDRNQFIRAAYTAGIEYAHDQLSDADIAFQRPDIDDLVGRPTHTSSLRELYTRTYEQLESVRDDVAQSVRDELLEGFREGKNPTDITRNLTDRINSIGKHRATLIARSETMNARSEGTLNRAEEINQSAESEISASHGEWDAAIASDRTCSFCKAVNGTELTISEMRDTAVVFAKDGRTYRLKPPAHPQGRCNISLTVGSTIDEPLADRLPASVQLIT